MKVLGFGALSDEKDMPIFGFDAIGQPAVRRHPIANLPPAKMNIFLL